MSHRTYDALWRKAQDLLAESMQLEPTTSMDAREQRPLLATLYVRYVLVANQLADVLEELVQPQKRILARRILEGVLGRLLEVKADLVEADLCEHTHCGELLAHLGVTPLHVELRVPSVLREEHQERRTFINSVLAKLGELVDGAPPAALKTLSRHEAIVMVQSHERARRARLHAQFMRQLKEKPSSTTTATTSMEVSFSAAVRIQSAWRGLTARRATRRRKLQEMRLIGMIPPLATDGEVSAAVRQNRLITAHRRVLREQHAADLERLTATCRADLEANQRAMLLERLGDEMRGWLYDNRLERSMSRLLMSRQGTTTDSELSKSSSKESKAVSKSKTTEERQVDVDEENDTTTIVGVKTTPSVFLPELVLHQDEYNETWKDKDESANPHQLPYADLVEKQETLALEHELRKTVDEMMRGELQLLQEALERDKGHKKAKKAGKKLRRSSKKARKRKEKDLTPDRTTESLFEELVANGIIKLCPEVRIAEFIGEHSSSAATLHHAPVEPPVALGDLRSLITELCVIPLLTQRLHEGAPLVRSVLLAGASGSGKRMLVHAACHEAGATLFDLTPANLAGKYPGKSGLIMLLHLVAKVARLLQPSIIHMDGAERPFVKKVPKGDRSDPKRLRKDLPKLVRNFCAEERILLIGTTSCPWEADQKLLAQVYEKFLVIHRPDYSSRYALWTHLLGQHAAISRQFDYSGVAKISDGYTAGAIVATANEVLTVKRKLQLRIKPLSPLELINALAKRVPVYKEEEEAMLTWWSRSPMVRRRQRAAELLQQLQEEEEEQATQKKNAKRK